MAKVIIRETIISLLVCLAILLILSVLLYNYIPTNKVVPEAIQYTPTKEIQAQLSSSVDDNSSEILMTYEITAQDLDNYERINEYNPGKANPFAAYSEDSASTGTQTGDGGNITGTPIGGSGTGGTGAGGSSGGSLFEGGSSK